jgi:hypothetical protein
VNILHHAGYQTDIRNVFVCCISLFKDAIPVQQWYKLQNNGFPNLFFRAKMSSFRIFNKLFFASQLVGFDKTLGRWIGNLLKKKN